MLKNDAILVILCYNYCKIKTVENKIILEIPLRVVDGGRHSRPSALYNSGGRYLLDNLKRSKNYVKV